MFPRMCFHLQQRAGQEMEHKCVMEVCTLALPLCVCVCEGVLVTSGSQSCVFCIQTQNTHSGNHIFYNLQHLCMRFLSAAVEQRRTCNEFSPLQRSRGGGGDWIWPASAVHTPQLSEFSLQMKQEALVALQTCLILWTNSKETLQVAEKHSYHVSTVVLLVLFVKIATIFLFFNPALVTALSPLLAATSSTSVSAERKAP